MVFEVLSLRVEVRVESQSMCHKMVLCNLLNMNIDLHNRCHNYKSLQHIDQVQYRIERLYILNDIRRCHHDIDHRHNRHYRMDSVDELLDNHHHSMAMNKYNVDYCLQVYIDHYSHMDTLYKYHLDNGFQHDPVDNDNGEFLDHLYKFHHSNHNVSTGPLLLLLNNRRLYNLDNIDIQLCLDRLHIDHDYNSLVHMDQFESHIGIHHSLRNRNNTVDCSDLSDMYHDCIDNLHKDHSKLVVRSDNLYIEQDNGNRPNLLGLMVEYNNHH